MIRSIQHNNYDNTRQYITPKVMHFNSASTSDVNVYNGCVH